MSIDAIEYIGTLQARIKELEAELEHWKKDREYASDSFAKEYTKVVKELEALRRQYTIAFRPYAELADKVIKAEDRLAQAIEVIEQYATDSRWSQKLAQDYLEQIER